jgi:hypothetical protein
MFGVSVRTGDFVNCLCSYGLFKNVVRVSDYLLSWKGVGSAGRISCTVHQEVRTVLKIGYPVSQRKFEPPEQESQALPPTQACSDLEMIQ